MENRAGKLATLAAASAAIVGATAVLEPQPASASFPTSARIFEVREREKPVPVESRPTSPLPYAGGEFHDDPMDTLVRTEVPPPPPERAVEAPPVPRQSFSALTSFDESVEMTSGDRQAPARTFPPPPAQWNNPIQWLATHHQ